MKRNKLLAICIEWKARCVIFNESWLRVFVSIFIVIGTIILWYYYPQLSTKKRCFFLINSIWPSGIIVVLVPMWTELVREWKKNIGYFINILLEEKIHLVFADNSTKKGDLLSDLRIHRKELIDKTTRRETIEYILEQIDKSKETHN